MRKVRKRAKKPKKKHICKRRAVEKCVRLETCPIGDAGFAILERMFDSYAHCKQMFLDRLSGIGSVLDVQNFISLRNRIRTEQNRIPDHAKETGNKTYCEIYGFQGRFWVQALKDASSTVKSMWKNVGAECRAKLRDNDAHRDMPKPERAYCNYVLGAPQVLYCILNQVPYEGKISKRFREILDGIRDVPRKRMDYLHSLLRRLVRDNLPHPQVGQARCMLLDEAMYSIKTEDGADYLYLMTDKRGKLLRLKLHGRFCYNRKGDIQIILDREKRTVSIHKCIFARQRVVEKEHPAGIDKGYATLISCMDPEGNSPEYGKNFGKLISSESERINQRNTNKNYFYNKRKDLQEQLDKTRDPKERERLDSLIQKVERDHLGRKKYDRQHKKAVAHMEAAINHHIRTCMEEMKPSETVLEDLSFVSDKKRSPRKDFNRHMASWQKGYLDERLDYLSRVYGAGVTHVNPAYTSQYCNHCGAKLGARYGFHHEYADCENCGTVNANTNAAGNILDRRNDKKIMLYTPYRRVKQICDRRAEPLNAAVDTAGLW